MNLIIIALAALLSFGIGAASFAPAGSKAPTSSRGAAHPGPAPATYTPPPDDILGSGPSP